jgi:nicotinamidase-related amidase
MKALLLIDIQNDYFPGGKMELVSPESAAANAEIVLSCFRRNKLPIIHVQHINTRAGATFFLPETEGARIHSRVSPQPGEHLIVKHAPNSFYETNLIDIVREQSVTELTVCGMMTHMCIDTTVRAAKD